MKLELIRKTEGEEAAKLFMEENASNISFKRVLIEEALKTKDYKKAELLAIDGIKTQRNSPFRSYHDFQNYLLTIYLQTGREQEAIALARSFLIEFYEPRRMYDLLKSRIPHPQWQEYLRAIIDEIKDTIVGYTTDQSPSSIYGRNSGRRSLSSYNKMQALNE